MHHDELWQEYSLNGTRLNNGGRSSALDNPTPDDGVTLGIVLVWLYRRTDDGPELLFQQRAPQVNNGGLWDVSAGGHINYREPTLDAAIRECREEIGATLTPDDLQLGYVDYVPTRFRHYYFCDWTGHPDKFHFDDHEVSAVRWVRLSELDTFIDQYAKPSIRNSQLTRHLLKHWLTHHGNLESK